MSDTRFSPLELRIMLAFAVTLEPQQFFPDRQWTSKPADQARNMMRGEGLLDGDDKATNKLLFYINHLCRTPLPIDTFTIPERGAA